MTRRLGILALASERHGGTFQYTLSMIEALLRMPGWTATLYTGHGNDAYARFGLPTRHLTYTAPAEARQLVTARLGLRTGDPFEGEDVVISPIKSPLLLHTRRPFVFTLHDLQERYLPQYSTRTRDLWLSTVYSSLLRRAAGVICESRHVAADIHRFYGYPPARIHVIAAPPVAMDDAPADPERLARLRRKFDLPASYLFYPARFWPHKNHRRLVEAFAAIAAQFPDVGLVFTGRQQDEYANVFGFVRDAGLTGRVISTGYIEQHELHDLYRLATAVVVPTLFESVSIPVYEAQQLGRAVAASDILAIPEQIGDTGLLFDPLSVDAIAGAMRRLLADPAERDRLAHDGARRVAGLTADRYAAALDKTLAAVAARAPTTTS